MEAIARALDVSLDWLATGETRTPEELAPDEQALVDNYRAIDDEVIRGMILRMAQEAPKREG